MTYVHIYTAKMQPATGWIDTHSAEPMHMGFPPETMLWCECCNKKRPAKNCSVQSFYDHLSVWCTEGHGCKDPQTIANKRRREHMYRSRGQQKRWAVLRAAAE